MVKGAAGRRLLAPGALHLDRRIGRTLAVYLVVITVIVGYNARAIADQRGSALSVNVAARQRALAERYEKDVILTTLGIQADPGEDAQQLLANADALLHGGEVLAVQGADQEIKIRPASRDPIVAAKLNEENRLIQELITVGDALYAMRAGQPGYQEQLRNLRIVGAQVTSISNDAVGQMTRETESALARLVAVVITLGVLGAIAALAMAWFLRRTAAQRAAQFRSLVHNASDLITVLDETGEIRYQSPSAEQLVGVSSEELIGSSYLALLDENDGSRLRSILADLATAADPTATATAEYRLRHEDGSWRSVESIVGNQMSDPTVKGLVLNTRDVTDRKLLQEELAHQAFHDSLTGLSNRAVFRDRVDHALARATRTGSRSAVFLLDLDGFKTVNDSLGHDAGDQLLIAAAQRLQFQGRSSDTVARIGGDEFGILLEDDADETSARAMADRLLAAFSVPFEVRGRELFVRATIGIALSVAGESNTDEMIRNADTAMYAAKAAGKARYEFFRPFMHARALERFEVQADLEQALIRNEFVVHYQPIVDFETGKALSVEALVRWNHPTRGLLGPLEFIHIAEDTGVIVPLGLWVLGEACKQTVAWRSEYPEASDLRVSVNLSTRQLLEPDLVARVRQTLEASELQPAALTLELTEGSLMQKIEETVTKLRALKELGVRLAIDDFGTGSSSLGYLQRFPIDILKIDKSFVDGIAALDSEDPALVRAIVEMAKTLRLETVAEGIEETEQLAELRSAGCLSGQGYLFARPLHPDAMGAFLSKVVEEPLAMTRSEATSP
ncbi:MAG: EAL domain-containing protein [Actinomycetota bacterium]|nr:EAL domain-containing protein [Actinomycetota bacterium]